MEEKAEKPSEHKQPRLLRKKWHCPICGARIWLSNKKRHTRSKKHNDAKLCNEQEVRNKLAHVQTAKSHMRR